MQLNSKDENVVCTVKTICFQIFEVIKTKILLKYM